jgi:acyl-CoA synthetase (AMP-forming)/AMP-acid ligase II
MVKLIKYCYSHTYAQKGAATLSTLPQSHAFGLILMLMNLKMGATFVMQDTFDLQNYLRAASIFKVTP